jgi:hypothetical protein
MKKAPMKMLNLPFEATFRLQVRLPRQQLYVCRVSPKTSIQQILEQVSQDKGFDPTRYELRKTGKSKIIITILLLLIRIIISKILRVIRILIIIIIILLVLRKRVRGGITPYSGRLVGALQTTTVCMCSKKV